MDDKDREELRRKFDHVQEVKWEREFNEALRELQEGEDDRINKEWRRYKEKELKKRREKNNVRLE